MKRVYLESPYAGNVVRNMAYLKRCVLDCIKNNESAFASHGFFTHFLDDTKPEERALGIEAGLAWAHDAAKVVVYTDYGISNGMRDAIRVHGSYGRRIEYRQIGKNPAVAGV